MKIILFITPDKKISKDVSSINLENHNLVVLNNINFFKHYLEEYMPEYIILSSELKNYREIAEYVCDNTRSELLTVGPEESRGNLFREIYLGGIRSTNDIERVLRAVDNLNSVVDEETGKNYKLIGQQVISFCSIQGGVGKTSIVFNFAWYARKIIEGKILIVDLNFCEGPSDLAINLDLNASPNLSVFIEKITDGRDCFDSSVVSLDGDNKIDILQPPLSIYQSDKFNIDMLDSIVYSARNKYGLIIADIPFRYDNISLEMLNLSTASIMVLSPDIKLVPRINNFKKFLPERQKKGIIFNKVSAGDKSYMDEFNNITGIPVYDRISLIPEESREAILNGRESFNILNLQSEMSNLVKSIF
jgi:MinD-like ATPase involved in chromosome partitioning or flagellar assembly